MTPISDLLARIRSKNIALRVEGERLRFVAPRGALSDSLRSELKQRKAELLEFLHDNQLEAGDRKEEIVAVTRPAEVPLSFAQQRLWFLDRLEGAGTTYHICGALRIDGPMDREALRQSLSEIVRRHEALRTVFRERKGKASQHILPPSALPLGEVDLRHLPSDESEAALQAHIRDDMLRPFDLEQGPLLRFELLRLRDDCAALVFTLHHIIADGWSLSILSKEFVALYQAFAAGQKPSLPELPVQYADFALWQRRMQDHPSFRAHEDFWREVLADAPPTLSLPTDRPRPLQQSFRGATVTAPVDEQMTAALREFSRQQGCTLFMTLLTAYSVVLARLSRSRDIVVGVPIANRGSKDLEGLIGFFANTLALRIDCSANPGFADLLQRVKAMTLQAFEHQDLPFERIVEMLQPERSTSHTPVFQVAFVLQNTPPDGLKLHDLTISPIDIEAQAAKFELTLYIDEQADTIRFTLEYKPDLFDRPTVERFCERLLLLLRSALASPATGIDDLPLTTGDEEALIASWHRPPIPLQDSASIHGLFAEQARRRPDAIALLGEQTAMSYSALYERARSASGYLSTLGLGAETRIGLCADRSPAMIAATLAILMAGGAYVPLDPAYPSQRLAQMLADADVELVIVQGDYSERMQGLTGQIVDLDTLFSDQERYRDYVPPETSLARERLAYLMFTSGSTGRPKGVAVSHKSVLRLVRDGGFVEIDDEDVMLQMAPGSFDAATFEIWAALLNGAKLLLMPPAALSLEEIGRSIERHGVTTLWLTAGLFNLMVDEAIPELVRLRYLLAGGEALSLPHVRRARELYPDTALINGYGPTENTTFTCCHTIREADCERTSIPIGRPIRNTYVRILDAAMRPVAIGVAGELYIGGDGLARGYANRPALSALSFVPDPLGDGARLYRSGDLARFLADGALEFLGRIDAQVKLRGFRIEPGEIEAALADHPGLRQSAVVIHRNEAGSKELIAYYNGEEGAATSAQAEGRQAAIPNADSLRAFLNERLPDYMIPARFIAVAHMPLTANGKVDRRALPSVESSAAPAAPPVALGAAEEILAGIWSAVLGRETIHAADYFFDLGGHSLLALQVVARVREAFKVELPVRRIFEAPVLRNLAQAIERLAQEGGTEPYAVISVMRRPERIPLSFAQQRMWFLAQIEGQSASYNIPAALRLRGPLDLDALARTFTALVARHESLRTTYIVEDGVPFQRIAPVASLNFDVVDASDRKVFDPAEDLQNFVRREAAEEFDLSKDLPLRLKLLRLADDDYVLLLTMHHIASDGWSMGVLIREVLALYHANVAGHPANLPLLPIQYADFALWQRSELSGARLEAHLDFWREQLAGAPALLHLPSDRKRPLRQSYRGQRLDLHIDAELAQGLVALGRSADATLFMTLLTAFAALLHRYAGQNDIVVGTPVANRTRRESEGLIGLFVNTLALRVDCGGRPDLRTLLARVKQCSLAAYAHQDLPFEKLVEELQPERSLSHTPLFQVLFVLQNAPVSALDFDQLEVEAIRVEETTAKFDLTLSIEALDSGLQAIFEYNSDLFDSGSIRRLAFNYVDLLSQIVADDKLAIDEFSLAKAESEEALQAGRRRNTAPPAVALQQEFSPAEDEYALRHELTETVAANGHAPAIHRQAAVQGELAAVWRELLHCDEPAAEANFFALGGHSLLATQLVSRIRKRFGLALPLGTVFENPRLGELAARIAEAQKERETKVDDSIRHYDGAQTAPLSFAQERLWFLAFMRGGAAVYNMPFALRLEGIIDLAAINYCLAQIVRRHAILRTRIVTLDDVPEQQIDPPAATAIEAEDLHTLSSAAREAAIEEAMREEAAYEFRLEVEAPFRARLLRLSSEDDERGSAVLIVNIHHIAGDAWSFAIFVREFAHYYAARREGREAELAAPDVDYADFARWQRRQWESGAFEEHKAYWLEHLRAAPPFLNIPTDRPRPDVLTHRGALLSFDVDAAAAAGIRAISAEQGTTIFMSLLTVYSVLLARLSNQRDIIIGTPIANRNRSEWEELMGVFVNTLALRIDLDGSPGFRELLQRVRAVTLAAYEHQDMPFEQLVHELKPERDLSRSPLFQVMFDVQNVQVQKLEMPDVQLTSLPIEHRVAKFDLTLSFAEDGERLYGALEYNCDLYDRSSVAELLSRFMLVLRRMIEAPDADIFAFPLLDREEMARLHAAVRRPPESFPPEGTLQGEFARQVRTEPQATALVWPGGSMSYIELDRRADYRACILQARGVGPEKLVGICLDRGPEMLVSLIAILKAGAAYLPLDPAYPSERLAYMLDDAAVELVLSSRELAGRLPEGTAAILCVEDHPYREAQPGEKARPAPSAVAAANLAYLIYTSGSSGRPRGVQISHRSVVSYCHAVSRDYQLSASDRWLQFASINFDGAVEELFASLLTGAALVLWPSDRSIAADSINSFLTEYKVSVFCPTTALWHEWSAAFGQQAPPASLRLLVVGGEAIQPALFARWWQTTGRAIAFRNSYGPTEATVACLTYDPAQTDDPLASGGLPLGSALDHRRVYLLDQRLQPVPQGVVGELFIAGEGLARAYQNRAALTAERFLPDLFAANPGERMYRSGDLARQRADGTILFVGRADQQVKLRGFRVELGEIESCFAAHPAIRDCVASLQEDKAGHKQLILYACPVEGPRPPIRELRTWVRGRLPSYMQPAHYQWLQQLPLTANGKVNRRALPALSLIAGDREREAEEPVSDLERAVAALWRATLGLEAVARHENFFDIGGNSLKSIALLNRLEQQFPALFEITDLFDYPTIAEQAEQLELRSHSSGERPPAAEEDVGRLTL